LRTKHGRVGERGAALAEAVIVIPVLILLWASIYYAGGLFLTQQKTEVTARSCAWLYSANNCEAVPAGCADYLAKTTASSVPPEIDDVLKHGAENAMANGDAKGIVQQLVGELVAAPLVAAFTGAVDAKVEQQLSQPAEYGGGIKVVSGRYHLACNLAHDTPEKMADRAWSSLVHF
jgi:hypothetical protein